MKSKFLGAPDSVMKRAEQQIMEAKNTAGQPMPAKVQSKGAAGKLAETLPQTLPIVGQKLFSSKRVRIREGMQRAESEYADAEFKELQQSIEESGGNVMPIDVRVLTGVPGFDAELLAGTRRLMACQALGLNVLANIRECDDRMADRIHEVENKHRKNKSPYSRGLQYSAMMKSGTYASMTELSETIGTRLAEISECMGLIDKAPAGMWAKVTDAGSIGIGQARQLMQAYPKPNFIKKVEQAQSLDVAELLKLANAALRPSTAPTNTTSSRLGKRGKDYIVMLPSGIPKSLAEGAVEAAQRYLESQKK